MGYSRTLELPGYRVLQYLGSGARSTIWQVQDSQSGRVYALKRVVRREAGDAPFLVQAINEYEIGSNLDHPNVRGIYSMRRVKRWLSVKEIHLFMEYCEGRSVQENRPESVEETVRVFGEVANALAYFNGQGFVHADTKPNNILVAPDGTVKVVDFGQSCALGTVKQRIQGTPDFIAPEQVHRRPLDARTDVFNFGAALYWALSGRAIPTVLPKRGAVTLVTEQTVTPVDKLNPAVPAGLSKLIQDCIEPQPTRRPGSMNEVVSRLSLISHKLRRDAENGPC